MRHRLSELVNGPNDREIKQLTGVNPKLALKDKPDMLKDLRDMADDL